MGKLTSCMGKFTDTLGNLPYNNGKFNHKITVKQQNTNCRIAPKCQLILKNFIDNCTCYHW